MCVLCVYGVFVRTPHLSECSTGARTAPRPSLTAHITLRRCVCVGVWVGVARCCCCCCEMHSHQLLAPGIVVAPAQVLEARALQLLQLLPHLARIHGGAVLRAALTAYSCSGVLLLVLRRDLWLHASVDIAGGGLRAGGCEGVDTLQWSHKACKYAAQQLHSNVHIIKH